jgi:hypothetical protein
MQAFSTTWTTASPKLNYIWITEIFNEFSWICKTLVFTYFWKACSISLSLSLSLSVSEVLGFELRPLVWWDRHSTSWVTPSALFCVEYFWNRVLLCAWDGPDHDLPICASLCSWGDRHTPPYPAGGWEGSCELLPRLSSNCNLLDVCFLSREDCKHETLYLLTNSESDIRTEQAYFRGITYSVATRSC